MRTDRQTEGWTYYLTKLIFAFRNSAPSAYTSIQYLLIQE